MNSRFYPIWWEDTVTIYNRYMDKVTDTITWYRTVVKNCFLKTANNKVTIDNTTIESNDVLVRIREDKEHYKSYGEWVTIPNDEQGNYFTLHQGDIIAYGEVEDEIDEYTRGKRSTDLISKLKDSTGCFIVEIYQENVGSGRVNPHYFASGV